MVRRQKNKKKTKKNIANMLIIIVSTSLMTLDLPAVVEAQPIIFERTRK